MKACSACARLFPDDAGFCPVDGNQLIDAAQVPVPPNPEDARIGQILCNRYQVWRVVADGGMGRVYEAIDTYSQRHVALKVLHPEVATDEVALERFRQEFQVSKQLPHNFIVEVFDFQPTQDQSYALAMEFLYGEELRGTLKRESVIPPERVVRMISQAAVALDEAHGRGLVHRDLKPDNVFLCQTREGDMVKILDFGSVKDKTDNAKKLTVMGTTIGSPFYMSPEQAQGLETLDHRADVWALAAITYECVTGKVPFKGANGPSILLEILTKEPVPPSQVGAGLKYPVPPSLDRVMAHGLRKQAGSRIPSVGAFADALGRAYGLEGNHYAWAKTQQSDLGSVIAAKMGGLMSESSQSGPSSASDGFFGEAGALDVLGDPFAASAGQSSSVGAPPAAAVAAQGRGQMAYGGAPAPPAHYGYGDDVPVGVPTSNLGLVLALIGAGVVVVVVIIVAVIIIL